MFKKDYNLKITLKILLEKYHNEMTKFSFRIETMV